jgi:hypothetical protein
VTPARGWPRAVRGLSLAAACLALSGAAHAAAGGGLPVSGPFLFGAALVAVAAVALADRQRSAGEIFAVVLATQPVLHVLLSLSAHGPGPVAPTASMVAAHIGAAVTLAALLAGGETLVWSFAALAATVLLRTARQLLAWSPVAAAAGCTGRLVTLPADRQAWRAIRSAPHRGPPVPGRC